MTTKKVKVISRANLPSGVPLTLTIALYLLTEHLNAVGWVKGAVWTVLGLLWLVCIFAMINQEICTPKFEE